MTKTTESKTNKTILRVIFAAAVVLLFCGAVVGAAAAADTWAEEDFTGVSLPGAGTEADPYQISTGLQLAYLAQLVNTESNIFEVTDQSTGAKKKVNYSYGKYFKLMNDINLQNKPWTPIGTSHSDSKPLAFQGTFDGNGKTISKLTIIRESTVNNLGLFGAVSGTVSAIPPKISNLKILNVEIEGGSHLGALIGEINYAISPTVDDCHVSGVIKITGASDVGGLVGLVNHENNSQINISKCSVIGNSDSLIQGSDVVGGIVGGSSNEASLVISDCASNIDVKGQRKLGGIVGQIFSGTIETKNYIPSLTNVKSYGKIIVADTPSGKAVNSGTIVGFANINSGDSVTITNAVSYGSVEGWDAMSDDNKKTVGLVGGYKDNKVSELRSCVIGSTYYVTSDDDDDDDYLVREPEGSNNLFTGGTLMVAPVAKIGDKEYYTLEQAIAAATTGQTITLIADVDLTGKYVYPGAYYHPVFKDNVTLDLNGKKITSTNASVWYQGTNLTIKNGTFVSANGGSYALGIGDEDISTTTATLEDLTCVGGINVYNADVTINSTTSTAVTGTKYYAIWCDENAHVIVNGGTFTSPCTMNADNSKCVLNCAHTEGKPFGMMIINGGKYSAIDSVKLFADNTESLITVCGGEFNKDPTTRLALGYKAEQSGDVWVVQPIDAVAQIGTKQFATLQDAINVVQSGQTIELLKNIELSAPVRLDKGGTFTIDGKNFTISEAADAGFGADGCLCFGPGGEWTIEDIPTKNFTLKNVTLTGFKTDGKINDVIRAEGCTLTIDNCTFKENTVNGTARSKAVVLTTGVKFTIKNSTFQNNTCGLCIDFNTQGGAANPDNASEINVDNCLFKENIVTERESGDSVIYVYGPAGTIKDSTFESNTINGNGVGVIYFSGKLDSLTGCLFKSNSVTETDSGKCGVLSFGSGSAGTAAAGNAFDGNTQTPTSGKSATVYVEAVNLNLSKNYWDDGAAPETGDGKDIYIVEGKTGTVTDPYAIGYTKRTESNGVTVTLQPTTATVTFDTQGHGTAPASQTVDIGGKITRPADPTAWGFKFVDWYTDSGYTTPWNFGTDTVSKDMTLYAKWESVFYIAKMPGYTYGAAVLPSPSVDPAGLPDVSYVYSTLASGGTEVPWVNITTTTLDAGTWYIGATSSDKTADIRRSAFIVEKAPRDAPVFTVDASTATVTIANYDANETYRYMAAEKYANAADGWKTAPGSSFTLSGLKAGKEYTLTMKIAESRNYKESASASQDFTTPGYYTVNYYANGGVGSIDSETAQQGTEITVKFSAGISRTGYYFNEWNTKADGNGTAYTPGTPVYDGMDLYAQWTPKQYTIIFDAKGGTVTPASGSYAYTDEVTLPVAAKDGSVFSGWAVTDGSPAVYTGKQKVQGLAESGTVTLYAVWTEETHAIKATITGAPAGKTITVTLMRGNAQIGDPVPVSGEAYDFTDLPAGTYNLVAKAWDGTTVVKTVTSAVILGSTDATVDISFPDENVDSIVDVKKTENTPAVVVVNLDEEAKTKAEGDTKVTVTLTVEAKAETAKEDTMPPEEVQVQESISTIKDNVPSTVSENPMLFLEISVKKETTQETAQETTTVTEPIRETSEVIKLIVPYDFTGKESTKVFVYRVHDGKYEPLKNNSSETDGTYQVKKSEGLIYIYAKLFSTYSVGYETESSKPSSGSSSSGTSVWATPTPTPAVPATEPTTGETPGAADVPGVKPIETPSGTSAKTPAPFLGILAGLGAAAAVFGLRRK